MSNENRQGRISGWLKMNQSSVGLLAAHLDLSSAQTSRHCNAVEVPTAILAAMKTFQTPTKKHIPIAFLPRGKDKTPGPRKGWIDRRMEEVKREAAGAADTA